MLLSAADDGAGCKAGGSVAALACQADTWLGQLTGARQTSCTGRQTGRLAGRQAQGLAGPVCSLQPVLAWKPKVAMLFCSSSFTARAMSSLAAQQGGGSGRADRRAQAGSVDRAAAGATASRNPAATTTGETLHSTLHAPTCEDVVEGHAGQQRRQPALNKPDSKCSGSTHL